MALKLSRLTRTSVLIGGGVVVLIVGVLILSIAALRQGSTPRDASPERAVEPFPSVSPTPTAEPAPTPEPVPVPQTLAGGSLALAGDLAAPILWRASAATCLPGAVTAPVTLERGDAAGNWQLSTPAGAEVREVLWLQSINATAAEMVALVGPDCTPETLRTFTSGQFWEPYPASITGAVWADQAGLIHSDAGELPAACTDATRAIAGTASPAVACAGQFALWSGADWQATAVPGLVAAAGAPSAANADQIVTAREGAADCSGVLLERWDGTALLATSCAEVSGVQAIAATATQVWLWHDGGVEAVDLLA